MAQPKTKPSTRRLSEVARHVVIPSGIVTTGWPEVERKCREFGDEFDEWQAGAGKVMLGKRADGIYAATVGGITLSIPRQVAKTWLVGRIIFALCVIFPGLRVIWTAHRTRTTTNTFRSLQGYAKRKKVAPHVADIRRTNGEQEIAFTNGSVILFGAREQGFGRGFDEVDIEVFDEAQILTSRALEDMVAATNQSRHPHGALLFFMGTPPRPVDPGEAFTTRRDEALSGESEDAVYIECSADEGANPDDQAQWAKANPSFPLRTPIRSMLRLRKNLPSDESWLREGLGIWSSKAAGKWLVIPKAGWFACADDLHEPDGPLAYALDVDTNDVGEEWCSIGCSDGVHVEIVTPPEATSGLGWVVAAVASRKSEGVLTEIALDPKGPAGRLLEPLERAGVKVRQVKADEFVQACGQLADDVTGQTLIHADQAVLNRAVAGVVKRDVGDGAYRFSRTKSSADIGPLNAVAIARWAALNRAQPRKPMMSIT